MMKGLRKGVGTVLQAGPIPVHVAFIMDGNRRFAARDHSGDVSAGHTKGFSKVYTPQVLMLSFQHSQPCGHRFRAQYFRNTRGGKFSRSLKTHSMLGHSFAVPVQGGQQPWCQSLQLLEALEWCVEVGIECVTVFAFSIDNFNRSAAEVEALMGLAETKLREMLEVHDCTNHCQHPSLMGHLLPPLGLGWWLRFAVSCRVQRRSLPGNRCRGRGGGVSLSHQCSKN